MLISWWHRVQENYASFSELLFIWTHNALFLFWFLIFILLNIEKVKQWGIWLSWAYNAHHWLVGNQPGKFPSLLPPRPLFFFFVFVWSCCNCQRIQNTALDSLGPKYESVNMISVNYRYKNDFSGFDIQKERWKESLFIENVICVILRT